MKRKTNDLPNRVFCYGTVPSRIASIINEDAAIQQMRLANRLWNLLVAIEKQHILRYRAIMHNPDQERVAGIKLELAALRETIKDKRKRTRKREKPDPAVQQRIDDLVAERTALIENLNATRDQRHADRKAELDALSKKQKHRVKRARQAAAAMGLFWGTYNDIVQRFDAGRKHDGELKFKKFRGAGTLTAQIMGGAPVDACVNGPHTFFQIDAATPGQRWRRARMRIGSNPDRSPIWLQIPVVYHRDIPAGCQIKSVSMTRRLLDRKPVWQLNVTVEMPARPMPRTGPAIALDIGWRQLPEGIRVGYWHDDAGQHGQVVISAQDIGQLEKCESLQSKCDLIRDEFLPAMCAWLDSHDGIRDAEWLTRTAALSQWRSNDRICDLVAWWRTHRLAGDDEIFAAAEEWRQQCRHLLSWSRNLQDQIKMRMREQYRVFAADMARRYGTVVIEEFDLSKMAKKPAVEDPGDNPHARANRQQVAPSVLRGAVLNAMEREGVRIVRVDPAMTTRNCHACGHQSEWDQAGEVVHCCADCGATWDQDHNAAINLLSLSSGGMTRSVVA